VGGYVKEGDAALPKLEDKPVTVAVDPSLRELFESSSELRSAYPEMFAAMRATSPGTPSRRRSTSSTGRWNDFGVKPTVTLMHVAGYAPAQGTGAVVVWKSLWASHYFNGGVSATFYRAEPDGSYLLHVTRLRVDGLGGLLGGLKRGKDGRGQWSGGPSGSSTRPGPIFPRNPR
jgi:hypothetical protein